MMIATQRHSVHEILNQYQPLLQDCHDRIAAELKATQPTAVLTDYFTGGKKLRGLLVFLAASAIGLDPRSMSSVAAALELIHGASLIHDDIIDQGVQRRGRPALHIQLGVGRALVLGDYLILRSLTLLQETEEMYGRDRMLSAWRVLSDYAQMCCLGQMHELSISAHDDMEEQYFTIVRYKTASQFAAAASIPGILAGRAVETEVLRTFAVNFGIAFQIHDDLLDLAGDAAVLGKPVGADLANGHVTLPVIYLERYGSNEAKRKVRSLQANMQDIRLDLAAVLKEDGILDRVKVTQHRYLTVALQASEAFHPSHAVVNLSLFASYALTDPCADVGTG